MEKTGFIKGHYKGNVDVSRCLKLPPMQCIREIIEYGCKFYGEKVVIREKISEFEDRKFTRNDLRRDVNALGTALIDMGFKGKHIALLSENSYYWVVTFLAVSCGVGVVVPLDKEMVDNDIIRLISKADSSAVITTSTFKKLMETRMNECPDVSTCILTNDSSDHEGFYTINDLIEKGQKLIDKGDTRYTSAVLQRNDLAAIIFTSGTTGSNKGVMLSHRNICANVENSLRAVPLNDVAISVLPMNHSFELGCTVLTGFLTGPVIVINDNLRHLIQNLRYFQPGMSVVVPLFLETFYKQIWLEAKKQKNDLRLKKAIEISKKFLKVGVDLRPMFFGSLKKLFGGKLDFMVCGGAPANPDILLGLIDLGFNISNGYGISECSPVISVNNELEKNPTSVGPIFPTIDAKINEPNSEGIGELWIKGDTVMLGYYKDPQATEDSFEDGWFKTGDYGKIDENRNLYITGRKKSLIVLDNGKNVFPEEIEKALIEQMPYAKEVIVYEANSFVRGKLQKEIAATLYVDKEENPTIFDEEAQKTIIGDIRRVNTTLPSYKQVHAVSMTTEEFEKTTTKKVIRQKVIDRVKEDEKLKV